MNPLEYVGIMRNLGETERLPMLIWDDVTRHLPSSLYFTDRDLYSAIKRYWPVTRSRFNVFICSAPLKDDVLDFIMGDMTGELFFKKRVKGDMVGHFEFQRHCWSIDYENPKKSRFEMVQVEDSDFPAIPELADEVYEREIAIAAKQGREPRPKLPGVPIEVFKKYWAKRMKLAKDADDDLMDEFASLMKREERKVEMEKPLTPESVSSAARALVRQRYKKG